MTNELVTVRRNIAGFLLIFVVLGFSALALRIAWLQFVDGKKMTDRVKSQLMDNRAFMSPRGTIYDRKGRELAVSVLTKSLYANPKELNKDKDTIVNILAPVLQMNPADIRERLDVDGSFIWIKRTLEAAEYKQVMEVLKENDIRGFNFVEESKRYYPNDTLAAHILGFVGTDDIGLEGIEMSQDKILKGQTVKQALETDNYGIPIFRSIFSFQSHYQGQSLLLTIDNSIQFIVEQSLDKIMADTGARGATIILMNPKTGEVLAMANRPTYNPNQFYRFGANERKDRAVANIYEPGSTFKTVVAAAAMQENLVQPSDIFTDNGFIEVSGRRIKNWSGDSYGKVSFVEVIKNSINTCFAQIGLRLGAQRLIEYARTFGFGKPTDIELPGEVDGLLINPGEARDSDVATMAIGQTIAVTPLQLLSAVSAIANDGVLLKPHIIKEIQNPDGTANFTTTTQTVRQVISPETAQKLRDMMEKVVSEGGGKKAAVKGYRFAGKTGTAERLRDDGSGYEPGRYIASFVGFGPIEDPQISAIIVIDSPMGSYYGGEIAAPVFSEMASKIMRYLSIAPSSNFVPASNKQEIKSSMNQQTSLVPPPGKVFVPNMLGETIREAGEKLAKANLRLTPVGSGLAVKQSIEANTAVNPGTDITVWFEQKQ